MKIGMKTIKLTVLRMTVVTLWLCTAGCVSTGDHYGHSEKEWLAMTEAQQVQAKADFERLVKTRQENKNREKMNEDMQKTIGMGTGGTAR